MLPWHATPQNKSELVPAFVSCRKQVFLVHCAGWSSPCFPILPSGGSPASSPNTRCQPKAVRNTQQSVDSLWSGMWSLELCEHCLVVGFVRVWPRLWRAPFPGYWEDLVCPASTGCVRAPRGKRTPAQWSPVSQYLFVPPLSCRYCGDVVTRSEDVFGEDEMPHGPDYRNGHRFVGEVMFLQCPQSPDC